MGGGALCGKNMDYLDFWREVEPLLDPVPSAKVFYRVYFDDQGKVLFYSMEDLPGNYLDIDRETFERADGNLRLKNGKLFKPAQTVSQKLVPSNQGTACHPNNVAIVDKQANSKLWKLKYYDRDS